MNEIISARPAPSLRHIERGIKVPMYWTNIACRNAGAVAGPMVRVDAGVDAAPSHPSDPDRVPLSGRTPRADPYRLARADRHQGTLAKPEYGDAIEVRPDELPVFWVFGVTPQAVIAAVKSPFAITHERGSILVTLL